MLKNAGSSRTVEAHNEHSRYNETLNFQQNSKTKVDIAALKIY